MDLLYQTKLLSPTAESVTLLAQQLRDGAVVGIPTETVYGLAANALSPEAVDQIFVAKGRPADNPLIVHIASLAMLQQMTAPLPPAMRSLVGRLADRFWPGALTLILPKAPDLPAGVTAGLSTVGVRMPAHPVALALIREAGIPLAAPSANLSGRPSPTTATHVLQDLDGRIPYILDGGVCAVGVESTVVRLLPAGQLELLRPGGVSVEQLREIVPIVSLHEGNFAPPAKGEVVASPGMKYRHYAPQAPMTLVNGGAIDFYERVRHTSADTALLLFDGEEELFSRGEIAHPCVTYGGRRDATQQAHRLFGALRQLDELPAAGASQQMFAHCPSREGMGLAVYNRLLRACSFVEEDVTQLQVIGLTGQTGAGKSLIGAELGKRYAIPVIDCDAVAHDLLDTSEVITAVLAAFPSEGERLLQTGVPQKIDRKALGAVVFSDVGELARLTQILYPRIKQELLSLLLHHRAAGERLVLLDAPTLFESGADIFCDRIIGVIAPKDQRKERIIERDHLTAEEAERRIAAGQEDAFYADRVDRLLQNHGSMEELWSSLTETGCLGDFRLHPPV